MQGVFFVLEFIIEKNVYKDQFSIENIELSEEKKNLQNYMTEDRFYSKIKAESEEMLRHIKNKKIRKQIKYIINALDSKEPSLSLS